MISLAPLHSEASVLQRQRAALSRELRTLSDEILERIECEQPQLAEYVHAVRVASTPNSVLIAQKALADSFFSSVTKMTIFGLAILIAASFPDGDDGSQTEADVRLPAD